MKRMMIHISDNYSDFVPTLASYILLLQGHFIYDTEEDTLNEMLDELTDNLVTAMESSCYKCNQDKQECDVLVTIAEEASECSIEFVSGCPDCVEKLAERVEIISVEQFEQLTKELERSKLS